MMKSNGFHLSEFAACTPKTRPLMEQQLAIRKHKARVEKRLVKLLKLPNGAVTDEIADKIATCEKYIGKCSQDLFNIELKINNGNFNRNSVIRERHVTADQGRIIYSKAGRYDVDEHTGKVPKEHLRSAFILD